MRGRRTRQRLVGWRGLVSGALAIAVIVGSVALLRTGNGRPRWTVPLPASAFAAPPGWTAGPLRSPVGVDASWPQCGRPVLPTLAPGFAVVGLTGGRPFTDDPCLRELIAAAGSARAIGAYANLAAPRTGSGAAFGAAEGRDAARRARVARAPFVWFDVETANYWRSPRVDRTVIRAALRAIRTAGLSGGVYTAPDLWAQVTGSARITVPLWLATGDTSSGGAAPGCDSLVGGRRPSIVQFVVRSHGTAVDGDLLCPGASPRRLFLLPPR